MLKSNLRIILLTICTAFLVSCATMSNVQPPANTNTSWEERQSQLSRMNIWDLKAMIAIRSQVDAFSAHLQWQQTGTNYSMSLFGPLGSNAVSLTGQPNLVTLETADGKHYTASSPESLLAEQMGWRLPVSNLYYWVRGLPVPNLPAQKQFDAYHRLAGLWQDGWSIQYLDYTSFTSFDLPSKIFLNNPRLNVKILIKQWQL